ncbi:hypothetical protein [Planobispora rosea]|uniref:hypothetical protein n=1 Tax=Planobispora rosea TaxID=35762 RepID=UPI00114CDE95|nr:hypothetical protein [Planobispora rosea]
MIEMRRGGAGAACTSRLPPVVVDPSVSAGLSVSRLAQEIHPSGGARGCLVFTQLALVNRLPTWFRHAMVRHAQRSIMVAYPGNHSRDVFAGKARIN